MAVRMRDRRETAERVDLPVSSPARRPVRVIALIAIAGLVGVGGGWAAYRTAADMQRDERIAVAQRIQQRRAELLVEHFELRWASERLAAASPTWRVRVTGTGPGLVHVAEQQEAFADRVITGTGPGLVTVAKLQEAAASGPEPTGTLGVEHLPNGSGPETAVVGTP